MAITYSWVISQLECYPEKEGLERVVFNIHWRRQAVDGQYSADVYGSQSVTLDEDSEFIEFEDLTKENIETWLEDSMGADRIAELDASLLAQINERKNPTVITPGLPWN